PRRIVAPTTGWPAIFTHSRPALPSTPPGEHTQPKTAAIRMESETWSGPVVPVVRMVYGTSTNASLFCEPARSSVQTELDVAVGGKGSRDHGRPRRCAADSGDRRRRGGASGLPGTPRRRWLSPRRSLLSTVEPRRRAAGRSRPHLARPALR